ncbi:MAG: dTDP-4-amino-4,6-dideoxygalactose transaminase [Alphaproteobacteria bacterium]|jgi:dTDP-4-amino-4,6-dideoxygalactose transaminase
MQRRFNGQARASDEQASGDTMARTFDKSFTQQEPIPEAAIERAAEIMKSGRLHRYNVVPGETSEAAQLEEEYATWQGAQFCLATTSGGQALQIALRAAGVTVGTKVLANAYTLAPVPGAIHAVGAEPVLVEIDANWHTDLDDLRAKAATSGARFFMLSHMRGHIADMAAIVSICDEFDISLIEDCAHTMGARWNGIRSGNFGRVACFSTQTYKHINSGEGGLLTTNDAELASRAVVISGSYMNYAGHGAIPAEDVFQQTRLESPNCSARLDNLRAALIRAQLPLLEDNVRRWNERYFVLQSVLSKVAGLRLPERHQHEGFVGSSIQFQAIGLGAQRIPKFVDACGSRGVDIKWFGADEPHAFTSRFDSWAYLNDIPELPSTKQTLATTCDLRVPLTFSTADCRLVAEIVGEEATRLSNS